MMTKGLEKKSATEESILYILKNVKGGRKKLMKLMFLVDYYDTSKKKLTIKKTIGNQFFVYYYGVFSREVMDSLLDLIKNGKVLETHYGNLETNPKLKLEIKNKELKEKLDNIIKEFGNNDARKLEAETLKMIKLTKENKYSSFGMIIDALLIGQ